MTRKRERGRKIARRVRLIDFTILFIHRSRQLFWFSAIKSTFCKILEKKSNFSALCLKDNKYKRRISFNQEDTALTWCP
jgi:hypothetical protein